MQPTMLVHPTPLETGEGLAFAPDPGTMDREQPLLAVVIVSWNTRALLERCLQTCAKALAQLPCGQCQVWVVDNASSDGTGQIVREEYPWVRLIQNTVNGGFARANNQAIEQCSGRYVMLLNPDTEVGPGAFAALLAFLENNPRVAAAGPQLLNPDGSLQSSCYRIPTLGREIWRMFHLEALWPLSGYRMRRWSLESPRPVEVIQGACLVLRRAALEQVGLLDANYFMYTEEVDLCLRLARAGWLLCWVPSARVLHYGGQSTRLAAAAMFLRLYESKVLFFRKHYGPTQARLYKLVLLLASLPRLVAGVGRTGGAGSLAQLAGQYRLLIASLLEM